MQAVIDRIVQYPNRYQLTNVETQEVLGTFDFDEVTGTVQQVGTEIDKELFDSIANDLAARVVSNGGELKDTVVTFTDTTGTAANVASGDKTSTLWSKVKNWFSRLKALAFKDKISNADVADDAAIEQSKVSGLMTDYVASISVSGRTVTYKNKNGVNMGSINTQDTTYELASPSGNGLMSATDKAKLDGIESGAQKNTVLGVKGSSESAYRTGNVNITKANIGLGNVDNTSDEDKPVSTATQTALNGKANTSGTYPNMTVGNATHATNADNATNAVNADNATFAETASALSRTSVVLAGNDSAKIGWWKIGEVTSETLTAITNFGGDYSAIFLLNGGAPYGSIANVAVSGLIELDGRVESGNFVLNNNQIKILCGNVSTDDVGAIWTADKIELYFNMRTSYSKQIFTVLSEFLADRMINGFSFGASFVSQAEPSGLSFAVNVNNAANDADGDSIADTYAKQDGTYPNLTAGEAKGLSKVGSVYADSASRVGWHKFAEVPLSALTAVSGTSSYSAIVLVNGLNPYQGGDTANSGIVEVDMRVDGSQFASSVPPRIKLLSGNVDIQKLCFKRTDTEVGLYINTSSIYVRYSFTVLDERYYLGRSIDAMEFADEYYGAAAPDGAVYATNVNQAAYAQEAAMLDEAYKAGNNSSASQNGYVKLIDFTADNNWAEKTLRLEFGDDNASNVPQNPCGMEMRVQWNSSVGVSPRAGLLYGDKQIADKLYVSYNPSFTEGEENTVSVYYKVSGGFDTVAYKPLYMTPRQGTDVTGVNFYQPTQSDLIAELPSGNTNTAITALENFRDLRYAKYDADGNDISDTYAKKDDMEAAMQRMYPVGSIYFSAVGTNPSELFGFGTWQAWGAGRVPVGVDASQTEFNAVEKTGGEKAHALTINEMPSHTHEISYRPIGDPSDDPFALFKSDGGITGTYNSPGTELSQDALEAKAAGGGQAHNNLQPYITCYMWKRIN